jgi:hypothetical protein
MEIDFMKRRKVSSSMLLLILLLGGSMAASVAPFSGCGHLVQGPNCVLFSPDNNPVERYALSNYGFFQVGSQVCVSGNLVPNCQPSCQQASGCIIDNAIDSMMVPPQNFQGCGILVQQGGCMLFAADSIPNVKFRLAQYGGFHVGDRVCVAGNLVVGCQGGCPGIDHCIQNNSISPSFPQGSYFMECGVLMIDSGCAQLFPGSNPIGRVTIDSTGNFHTGDTIRVFGILNQSCQSSCMGGEPCVAVDSIMFCSAPPTAPVLGRAIMKLINSDSLPSILAETGSTLVDSIRSRQTYLIKYADSMPADSMVRMLQAHPDIIFAEPSFEMNLPEVLQMSISFPDEAHHPYIRDVSPTQYYEQPAVYTVGIDSANLRSSGSGTIVAVIDNGIDFAHPAFAGALSEMGYDFFDNDPNAADQPGEAFGHGTFVSGLIRLVAPNCRLLPLRAFGADGVGNSFAIAQAIYYAIDHGAKVINMSFGVYESSEALVKACSTAVAAGVTLVAAAGSDSTFMPIYPAALPGVIAVSALDTSGAISYLSNYGNYMDVCAPGVNLYSSLAGTHEWGTWSGTSFAAALVTGSCALIRTLNDTLSTSEVEDQIRSSANKVIHGMTITPPDQYYGYGRIDAASAVWTMASTATGSAGDMDGSGSIDISDAVYLCGYIFNGGPAPRPGTSADVNCDGSVDISDAVFLLTYIFYGGDPPGCL